MQRPRQQHVNPFHVHVVQPFHYIWLESVHLKNHLMWLACCYTQTYEHIDCSRDAALGRIKRRHTVVGADDPFGVKGAGDIEKGKEVKYYVHLHYFKSILKQCSHAHLHHQIISGDCSPFLRPDRLWTMTFDFDVNGVGMNSSHLIEKHILNFGQS